MTPLGVAPTGQLPWLLEKSQAARFTSVTMEGAESVRQAQKLGSPEQHGVLSPAGRLGLPLS